jgi:hypothetical protein
MLQESADKTVAIMNTKLKSLLYVELNFIARQGCFIVKRNFKAAE